MLLSTANFAQYFARITSYPFELRSRDFCQLFFSRLPINFIFLDRLRFVFWILLEILSAFSDVTIISTSFVKISGRENSSKCIDIG